MNVKKIISVGIFGLALGVMALNGAEVLDITARQHYPWNGLVDLSFTVMGEAGAKYDTSFVAKDVVGGTNLPMKTLMDANGVSLALTNSLAPSSYKWIWNAAADLPSNFVAERVTVEGSAVAKQGLYMVIDLSAGSSAKSFPISYLNSVPTGGWTDEHKTSKLVLRRVGPGAFNMLGEGEVSLTKTYYIGIYETTQKQYALITGESQAKVNANALSVGDYGQYGPTMPIGDAIHLGNICYNQIRGIGSTKKVSDTVTSDSFMGKLRSKTSLKFDLPTEAQWEYACRGGTSTRFYWGDSGYGDYGDKTTDHQVVGLKQPNPYGLYDVSGNAWEWCRDIVAETLPYGTDPFVSESSTQVARILRGGWNYIQSGTGGPASSIDRMSYAPDKVYYWYYGYYCYAFGFRVALTLDN